MSEPAFQEYPITLSHPHFKASIAVPVPGSQVYDQQGNVVRQDYRGTPQMMPPVQARNESEEEYYRAQGYERAGKMDPSAWVRAHADAPAEAYVPAKYPMWKGGVLIMTAQEDPEAGEDDLNPPAKPAPDAPPAAQASEIENMRAQMAQMNEAMASMAEQSRAKEEEAAKLRTERDAAEMRARAAIASTKPQRRKPARRSPKAP